MKHEIEVSSQTRWEWLQTSSKRYCLSCYLAGSRDLTVTSHRIKHYQESYFANIAPKPTPASCQVRCHPCRPCTNTPRLRSPGISERSIAGSSAQDPKKVLESKFVPPIIETLDDDKVPEDAPPAAPLTTKNLKRHEQKIRTAEIWFPLPFTPDERLLQAKNFLSDEDINSCRGFAKRHEEIQAFLHSLEAGTETHDIKIFNEVQDMLDVHALHMTEQKPQTLQSTNSQTAPSTSKKGISPEKVVGFQEEQGGQREIRENVHKSDGKRKDLNPNLTNGDAHDQLDNESPSMRQYFAVPYDSLTNPTGEPSRRLPPEELGFHEYLEDSREHTPETGEMPEIGEGKYMNETMKNFRYDRDSHMLDDQSISEEQGQSEFRFGETPLLQAAMSNQIERDLASGSFASTGLRRYWAE